MEESHLDIDELLRKLLDEIDIGIFIKKVENGSVKEALYVNRYIASLLKKEKKDLIGKQLYEYIPPEKVEKCKETDLLAVKEKRKIDYIEKFNLQGIKKIFHIKKVPLLDKNGKVIALSGWVIDITKELKQEEKQKRLNRRLKKLLNRDTITGLLNKNALLFKLKNLIKKGQNFTLAILDLNNFQVVNHLYGFQVGDKVLSQVGKRLEKIVKEKIPKASVARINGDDFVILFKCGDQKAQSTIKLVEEIKKNIEKESINLTDNLTFSPIFTTAIYCSQLQDNEKKPEEILADLEMTLFRAKKEHKGSVVLYDEKLDSKDRLSKFLDEENLLAQALKKGNLEPFFQPIVCLETGDIEAFEALARIKSNDQYIPAGRFIDTAIKTGLISEIDKAILGKISKLTQNLNKKVFVNISAISLEKNHNTFKDLEKSLEKKLIFEITEQVAVEKLSLIEEIHKETSVRFAIDDFGTGYTSLKLVVDLAIDKTAKFLKIDGSLIKDIKVNKENYYIVETIVSLAKKLKLKTIAEFIEDEETYNLLKDLGVDYGQGYHISPPKPFKEIINETV